MNKEFSFERQATYIQYGIVTATSKEEAIQKIKDGEYDDIYDSSLIEEDDETISIIGDSNEWNNSFVLFDCYMFYYRI